MGKTLIVDFANFCHRCKAGFSNEGTAFLYKFVRNLRALAAEHQPTSLVFVKEGSPVHRYEIFKEYKQNRKVKEDDPKVAEKFAQVMELKEKSKEAEYFSLKNLEVTVLRHRNLEADDVIANYARFLVSKGEEVIIASTDKDFVQLLAHEDAFPNTHLIKVYDFGTKDFRKPLLDADKTSKLTLSQVVYMKALTGDKSDNIPGVPGFGPKKTLTAIQNEDWDPKVALSPESFEIFERNVKLVQFAAMENEDWCRVEMQRGHWDPAALMIDFHTFGFTSLVKESTLNMFYETFSGMEPAKLPEKVR